MKHRKAIVAATLGALLGCGSDSALAPPTDGNSGDLNPSAKADTLVLSRESLTVGNGDWVFLTVHAMSGGAPIAGKKITWQVSNGAIALVSVLGDTIVSVWGKSLGVTTITATADGKSSRTTVQVNAAVAAYVFVTPGVAAVEPGTTRSLGIVAWTANYSDLIGATPKWSSSDSSIVSVDGQGTLSAHREGTVIVSLTIDTVTATSTVYAQSPFVQIAASGTHVCGLKQDGRALCWGKNGNGELGDGTLISRSSAVQPITTQRFKSIAVGYGTCALTAAGEAYCWGGNNESRVPAKVDYPDAFTSITMGGSQQCGLTRAGDAVCWGYYPVPGAGSEWRTVIPPTRVASPVAFASLTAGGGFECGLTAAGKAYCWGRDDHGELGDSIPETETGAARSTPAAVAGGLTFRALYSGPASESICGITATSETYCWGNYVEDDKAPTTADCEQYSYSYHNVTYHVLVRCSPRPFKIASGISFKRLATWINGICGIDNSNAPYCWGGLYGIAGTSISGVKTPTLVAGGISFASISLSEDHYCGLSTSGAGYCWGQNSDGQVGDYSNVAIFAPRRRIYGRTYVPAPVLVASP